jgi:hypothetical protein
MKFDDLLDKFGNEPCFDFTSVALLFAEPAANIRTALYRFRKSGRILELRRGVYAFQERYRKIPLTGMAVAGFLYPPSYLSGLWALSWYGVIPEKTMVYTSVTTRTTRTFENSFGRFRYRTVKRSMFHGFETQQVAGDSIRLASPEKALMDLWYLDAGEWSPHRMESMRFEPGAIDSGALESMIHGSGIPRLKAISKAWLEYSDESTQGRIQL